MMDFFDHRIESLARSSVSSSSFMELSSAFTLGEAKKPFFVCDDNVVCPFECFHPLAGLGWGLMEELPHNTSGRKYYSRPFVVAGLSESCCPWSVVGVEVGVDV